MSVPKGVAPKPDVAPVQQSVGKLQASTTKTREYVGKLKESSAQSTAAVQRAVNDLDRYTGTDKIIEDAKAQLKIAEDQQQLSNQYIGWADGELANAWTYETQAGDQIKTLSGQIDTAHANETVAVGAVEKWKPIIDQVNKFWGLGAFAYGAKILARHLLILVVALVVFGGLAFIFARPLFTLIAMWFTVVISWFRKK